MPTATDVLARALRAADFEPPPDWTSRTIVTLSEPPAPGGGTPASVVLVSEPRRPGDTVHSLALQQIADLRDRRGLRVLSHCASDAQGMSRVEIAIERSGDDGMIVQTCTFIEIDEQDGPVILNVTATCSKDRYTEMYPAFSRLLDSARASAAPSGIVPRPVPRQISEPPPDVDLSRTLPPPLPASYVPMPGQRARR